MRTAVVYLTGVAALVLLVVLGTISLVDIIRELDQAQDLEGLGLAETQHLASLVDNMEGLD